MALIFLRSCHLLSKASPSPSHGYSSTLPFPLLSPHHLGGLVTRAGPDPIILWGSLLHMQIQIPSLSGNGSLLHMQIRIPSFSGGACYTCKSGSRYSQREFVTCADPDPIILRKWERPQIPNKQLGSKPTALLYSGPRGSLHMVSSLELPTSLSLYVMLHLEKRSN